MKRLALVCRVLYAQLFSDWMWTNAGAAPARGTAPVPSSYRRYPIDLGQITLAVLQHLTPEYERPPVIRQRRTANTRAQLAARSRLVAA